MNTIKTDGSLVSIRPWYKEFWLWFVLSPIITVVLVSCLTITLAVSGADKVVDGPYVKKGRMLYLDQQEDHQPLSTGQQKTKDTLP